MLFPRQRAYLHIALLTVSVILGQWANVSDLHADLLATAQAGVPAQVYADKGLEHFYSLEFDQAISNYTKAAELEPENPLHWTALADSSLFKHLLIAGRLDSQLYTASNEFLRARRIEPDPALMKTMWDALRRARSICEKRLQSHPNDSQAYYALGLTYAVEANYNFSVARRYLEALRAGTRAKENHVRAHQLDPSNHDASLLIGVYEYAVASIPASIRWLAYLAGYSGSKERGVQLLQDAMMNGRRSSPAALAMLAILYNREKQYSYSREMLQHLLRFFPRNYIYEMEIARSYMREGNLPAAAETYKRVAQKMESFAPGYDRVNAARLYFEIGRLLEQQRQRSDALGFYQKVVTQQEAGILKAQSCLRMGEIYLSIRDLEKAREMFHQAMRLPYPDLQRQAGARLRALSP